MSKPKDHFLNVLSAIIELWASGKEITQHEVSLMLGFRETKYVWNEFKWLEKRGVLYRLTHSFSHVSFIFMPERKLT